ncbi:hypothetical protein D3C79_569150 [compost metagenome]
MGERVGVDERRAVAHQRGVRHIVVLFRLDQQHIASELRAGSQGAIVTWAKQALAVGFQALTVQGLFGLVPFVVPVHRRYAQSQPLHWAVQGQQGG